MPHWLYIFWFLHQTTTVPMIGLPLYRCISFDSYIKPQLLASARLAAACCISFESYIKPQHVAMIIYICVSCISFESYIKPQLYLHNMVVDAVVYLLNPTSNHNYKLTEIFSLSLYIFWILHQTTTKEYYYCNLHELYIFWILHQTTTYQSYYLSCYQLYIFWILHQTTTIHMMQHKREQLYIFWILHQTTTHYTKVYWP